MFWLGLLEALDYACCDTTGGNQRMFVGFDLIAKIFL